MVAVAKEVSHQERVKRAYTDTPPGILSDQQIRELIESFHKLSEIEDSLFALIQRSESVEFTRPRTSKQKT